MFIEAIARDQMLYLMIKSLVSGVLIAAASTLAKRKPGFGAMIASLPLVSILGMIWLWRDTGDRVGMSAHIGATLAAGCTLTVGLYGVTVWLGPRLGLRL